MGLEERLPGRKIAKNWVDLRGLLRKSPEERREKETLQNARQKSQNTTNKG